MEFATIGDAFTNTARLFFLLVGLWGVVRALRGLGVDGSYFGALVIGQGLFMLLLIFSLVQWARGFLPDRPGLHYLYAFFAVLLLPYIYMTVLKGDDSNKAQWIYAFVTLFLFGVADRMLVTVL
jgi:hypothetical protein